jgi:hypothetical protein
MRFLVFRLIFLRAERKEVSADGKNFLVLHKLHRHSNACDVCDKKYFHDLHDFLPDLPPYFGAVFLYASLAPNAVERCWDKSDTESILRKSI